MSMVAKPNESWSSKEKSRPRLGDPALADRDLAVDRWVLRHVLVALRPLE